MLGGGVVDALVQTDDLHVLGHHVDKQIGGQTVGAVVQPLDDVAVAQGRDADRAALVVDLGIVVGHLELGHHVRQLTQFAVAQLCGGVGIQHGDLVIADLLHFGGKVAVGDGQQVAVVPGAEQLPADHRAHQRRGDQRGGRDEGHGAHQQYKDVEILALETDRRQNDIEIHRGEHQCDGDVQQRAAQGRAHGFAFLFRAGLAAEALKVGVVPICILHRRFLSLLICLLVLL